MGGPRRSSRRSCKRAMGSPEAVDDPHGDVVHAHDVNDAQEDDEHNNSSDDSLDMWSALESAPDLDEIIACPGAPRASPRALQADVGARVYVSQEGEGARSAPEPRAAVGATVEDQGDQGGQGGRGEGPRAPLSGDKWFNVQGHVLTPQLERDLHFLSIRRYLFQNRHYKKDHVYPLHHNAKSKKGKTKQQMFVATGTVVEDAFDAATGNRLTKAERRLTFTDQLLADHDFVSKTKKRFLERQEASAARGRGRHGAAAKGRRRDTKHRRMGRWAGGAPSAQKKRKNT